MGFMLDRASDCTVALAIEKSWAVNLRCAACGHTVRWGVADLQARFAGREHVTTAAIAGRAVCACGSREGLVSTVQDHAAAQARELAEKRWVG